MASIIKVDKLQEKTTGSGITLKAGLRNSSGTEIVSSTGSITPTTITTTGNVSVGGNLTSTGNISSSGNIVIANGQGIDFSAVSGSAAGSTGALLDDYEEGTFEPIFSTVAAPNTDVATGYSYRTAVYTKIGNVVFYNIDMTNTGVSGSGTAAIGNLPFISKTGSIYINGNLRDSGAAPDIPSGNIHKFWVQAGDDWLYGQYDSLTGGGFAGALGFWQTGRLTISGFYFTE